MEKEGFQELDKFEKAKNKFINSIDRDIKKTVIETEKADRRVLVSDIYSPKPIPDYKRAAMDGFAVEAEKTFGATKSSPIIMDLDKKIEDGGAQRVHTGSLVPEKADAVIKIEDVEKNLDKLEVFKAVSPKENVDLIGEDIEKGEFVFEKGHRLRPFDIGLLKSVGIKEVEVIKKPSILIVPTGDEIVSNYNDLEPGKVIESNSLMLKLFFKRYYAEVSIHDVVKDDKNEINEVIEKSSDYDLVVFSGGSSVGKRDYTAEVVKDRGEVFSHGIAIKPGKPTLLGKYMGTPIACLPGPPVACAISAILFIKPALAKLGDQSFNNRKKKASLTRKIESTPGYRTFTRVRYKNGKAIPVRTSGSGIQTSITSADGLVIVSEGKEGLNKGDNVEVVLFE